MCEQWTKGGFEPIHELVLTSPHPVSMCTEMCKWITSCGCICVYKHPFMHGEWITTDCMWSACQQPALPGFLALSVHGSSPDCSLQCDQKAEVLGLSSWRPTSHCPPPLLEAAPGCQLWSSACSSQEWNFSCIWNYESTWRQSKRKGNLWGSSPSLLCFCTVLSTADICPMAGLARFLKNMSSPYWCCSERYSSFLKKS